MLNGMELRQPGTDECEAVEALVQAVVDEIYGGLWASRPIPIGPTDWSPGWVAISQGKITGVALTGRECVEDMWVAANTHGVGVGLALLSLCSDPKLTFAVLVKKTQTQPEQKMLACG